MAAKTTVAKRYARAFLGSIGLPKAQQLLGEIEGVVKTLESQKTLNQFFSNPTFSVSDKVSVLEEVLQKMGVANEVSQFLKVVLEAGRFDLLSSIALTLKEEVLLLLGEEEALVESAYALTDSEKEVIKTLLEKSSGKKLRLIVEIKPEIVSGLKIKVGGKTFDSTLSNSLSKLQKQLIQAEA